MSEGFFKVTLIAILFIIILAISYFITAGLCFAIAWAFGYPDMTWQLAAGVWILIMLLRTVLK